MDKILEALNALYYSPNEYEKDAANTFLQDFQKSADAWQQCITILSEPSSESSNDLQAKLFAAQTLKSKILYDTHQIPPNSLMDLKDHLIQWLAREHRIAISRLLAVSLADLSLALTGWSNVIQGVAPVLLNTNPINLIEFLKVLPEEATTGIKHTALTDEEYSLRCADLLEKNAHQIIEMLLQFIDTPNTVPKSAIFECFASWLSEISVKDLIGTPLIELMINALNNPDTLEPATECLCTVIRETRDVNDYIREIEVLYSHVISLVPKVVQAKEDDPSDFEVYCRLFAEAGESWHVLIAKDTKYRPLVEAIAMITNYPEDLDVAKYSFHFWFELKQMLVLPKFHASKEKYADIYSSLMGVLVSQLTYPKTAGGAGGALFANADEEDKFKDFRYEIGDVLKDCCAVVGSKAALLQLSEFLKTGLASGIWQDVEAPLFAVRTMASEVDLSEDEVLPQFMNALTQLPEHEKIRYAAILALGRYTKWTAQHPQFLDAQLKYIIAGFSDNSKAIIPAAAQALELFCEDCGELLAPYVEQLHQFYGKIASELPPRQLHSVTNGIAHVVSSLPGDQSAEVVGHFTAPVISKLASYPETSTDELFFRRIADEVEILTIFMNVLRSQAARLEVLKSSWPVAQVLLERHGDSIPVAERTCKFIRTSIYSCHTGALPIIGPAAEVLVSQFQRTELGTYLYASSVIVQQFNSHNIDDSAVVESVWNFIQCQAQAFFTIVQKHGSIHQISPDLVEDFFRFMDDVCADFIVELTKAQDLIMSTLQVACESVGMTEIDAVMETLHFLGIFFAFAKESPPVSTYESVPVETRAIIQQVAELTGGELFGKLFSALIFTMPYDAEREATSVMVVLAQLVPSMIRTWLATCLGKLPSSSVSVEESTRLLGNVEGAVKSGNYKKMRSLVKDFTVLYTRRNITPRSMTPSNNNENRR